MNSPASIEEMYAAVRSLGERAGYTDLPTADDYDQENRIWIERHAVGEFALRSKERGKVWTITQGKADEVLFRFFVYVTTIAGIYAEIAAQRDDGDPRRQRYAEQARLMGLMRPEWRELCLRFGEDALRGGGGQG